MVAVKAVGREWWGHLTIWGSHADRWFQLTTGASLLWTYIQLWPYAAVFLAPNPEYKNFARGFQILNCLPDGAAWVMLIAGSVAALGMLGAYRPRLMAFISLVMLLTLQPKLGEFLCGGHVLLGILICWYLLMPKADSKGQVQSLAVLGFKVQVAWVYFASAVSKAHDYHWQAGDAIGLNLVRFTYETSLGGLLGAFQPNWLLRLETYLVVLVEAALLPALLLGWRKKGLIRCSVGVLILFHLGIFATMKLNPFPLIMTGVLLTLLDAEAQARLLQITRLAWRWPRSYKPELPPPPVDGLQRWRKRGYQAIQVLGMGFLLATFALETWNFMFGRIQGEFMGKHRSALVKAPWVNHLYWWTGYSQRWAMFTAVNHPPPGTSLPRESWATQTVVLFRNRDGKLFDPTTGQSPAWEELLLHGQSRETYIQHTMREDWDWLDRLMRHYLRLESVKPQEIRDAVFVSIGTKVNLPTKPTETFNSVNPTLEITLRPFASAHFWDGTPYDRVSGGAFDYLSHDRPTTNPIVRNPYGSRKFW